MGLDPLKGPHPTGEWVGSSDGVSVPVLRGRRAARAPRYCTPTYKSSPFASWHLLEILIMGFGPSGVVLNRCRSYVSNHLNTFPAEWHQHKLIKPRAKPVIQNYSYFSSFWFTNEEDEGSACTCYSVLNPKPSAGLSTLAIRCSPTCQVINKFWPVADKIKRLHPVSLQNHNKVLLQRWKSWRISVFVILLTSLPRKCLPPFKNLRAHCGCTPEDTIPIWIIREAKDG